ncbi:ferredoxin [Microbacterium sp. BF1]|uniref:ferredoxin n=1 Tax=Microbacterium sp. BF1 TaxID=2821146 RepID=UPI00211A2020|nr:ferredoxin [Microbacterium sp. BF1]
MTYVIALPCVDVKDKACIDECPVDCIYEGERSLYIHPDECVDCGACEPVCPVEAIYYEDDLPDEWQAPTPGTPAQERAKDAQYLQDRKQLEQRRTTSPEIRRPRTPTRSIER